MSKDTEGDKAKWNQTNTIEITFNAEYVNRPVYESDGKLSNAYFKEIYEDGIKIAKKIVTQSENTLTNRDRFESSEQQLINNIIAFVGERGVGKTSTILSFGNFLKNNLNNSLSERAQNAELIKIDNKFFSFTTLDIIDPTYIDNNESLLEVVVARMFSIFDADSKNENREHGYIKYREEVMRAFDDTFQSILTRRTYQSDLESVNSGGSVASLRKLSRSANLRSIFRKLVKLFLDFHKSDTPTKYYDTPTKYYLVIMIDDLDMRSDRIFDFSEEIRKYLMMPNILILMSFKYDQYKNGLLNNYLAVDKKLELFSRLSQGAENNNSTYFRELIGHTYKMVDEYLGKIFPSDQRINLMDISHQEDYETDCTLKISYVPNDGIPKRLSLLEVNSLFQYMAFILFDKTDIRLAFMSRKHPFTPDNLREYHTFINTLMQLDSSDKNKNRLWLQNYIVGNWAYEKLLYSEAEFLRKLSHSTWININHIICKFFRNKLQNEISSLSSPSSDDPKIQKLQALRNRLDRHIEQRSESLGLVLNTLAVYGKLNENSIRLSFAVRLLYTCFLKSVENGAVLDSSKSAKNDAVLDSSKSAKNDAVLGSLIDPTENEMKDKSIYNEYIDSTGLNILPNPLHTPNIPVNKLPPPEYKFNIERMENLSPSSFIDKDYISTFLQNFKCFKCLPKEYITDREYKNDPVFVNLRENLKKSLNCFELSHFFFKKCGNSRTFDILYILFSPKYYVEVCNDFHNMVLDSNLGDYGFLAIKENLKTFMETYSLKYYIKEKWENPYAEFIGSSATTVPFETIFPIYDLDFIHGILRKLPSENVRINYDSPSELANAYKKLFKKILSYIKDQNYKLPLLYSNKCTDKCTDINTDKCSNECADKYTNKAMVEKSLDKLKNHPIAELLLESETPDFDDTENPKNFYGWLGKIICNLISKNKNRIVGSTSEPELVGVESNPQDVQ